MYPEEIKQYPAVEPKLGIKSSLPALKPLIALLFLLWKVNEEKSECAYSESNGDEIKIKEPLLKGLAKFLDTTENNITKVISDKKNPLLASQLEALIVGIQLIWKLGEISFEDTTLASSAERTGGKRFPKIVRFSSNILLLDALFKLQPDSYKAMLFSWLKDEDYTKSEELEREWLKVLQLLSEDALYKIKKADETPVVFRSFGIYTNLLKNPAQTVQIDDANENKGPSRILKNIISENLNPYLKTKGGNISANVESSTLQNYADLLDTTFRLNGNKLIEREEKDKTAEKEQTSFPLFSVEWFMERAPEYEEFRQSVEKMRADFINKFGPEELKKLKGIDLLRKIFLNGGGDSLCKTLEYKYEMLGSIKGGSSYKYPLFYSQTNHSWMSGTQHHPQQLNEEEAIILGTKMRDLLVAGAECISRKSNLTSIEEYVSLYNELNTVTEKNINKMWFLKYYQILFPEIFPPIYFQKGQEELIRRIGQAPHDNIFGRMAQIRFYANQCKIDNSTFCKIYWDTVIEQEEIANETDFPYTNSKQDGINLIVYGTPGCGKSYYVQHNLLKGYLPENIVRTTFYQDYTNTDFVGQIIPVVKEDKSVTYEFRPGPFTIALERALSKPEQSIALVIEEINRGNAPSIFGDIFQLLDRNTGASEYQITNVHIQKYLMEKLSGYKFDTIRIPANMSIVATMNTSDQNVFTLDTAFKRRWDFEKLPNVFAKDHPYKDYFVPGMDNRTWKEVVTTINEFLVSNSTELQSEDKQIGVYFVSEQLLSKKADAANDQEKKKKFAYKLLEYLWNDVAKFERANWFGDIKSLDELIQKYIDTGETVFSNAIFAPKNK